MSLKTLRNFTIWAKILAQDMLVQYYYPQTLSPDRLDRYLADGWFRGANMLYRSQLICFEQELYSVINIRLNLKDYGFKKSLRKLMNRNGRNFRIEVGLASVTEAKEKTVPDAEASLQRLYLQ